MSKPTQGPVMRFLCGIWNSVNFARRLVLNVIFLLIVAVVLGALFSGGVKLENQNALVLGDLGSVVEQYSADPMERALSQSFGEKISETQVRDLLRAIQSAATDARIDRIVIRPDQLSGIGFATMQELATALKAFKSSGKQIIAYADGMDQKQYYLASLADEIYMHPDGMVMLEGLSSYRPYFREGLQEKLGVNVHLFRVGEYKSAAEPYILDAQSDEARAADLFWMSDIWQRFLVEVAERRNLDPAALQHSADNFAAEIQAVSGDMGQLALQQKLVDGLMTQDQFRALMIERGQEDTEINSFRQVSLQDYLGHLNLEVNPLDMRPKIAVVVAQGEIAAGDLPAGVVGGISTSNLLREAREDDAVHAVVLRVNSPGGGVFPSEQIRREVELTRAAGKPVVVSMGDLAASGGYWISMNADKIYAQPSTITGSIGIFGLFMTFPETLSKLGVNVDGVGTTKMAGAFDPTRPISEDVSIAVQAIIDQGYRQFIGKVAEARNSTPEKIDEVARGRVWSGAQAESFGLVDALGGLTDAISDAAVRANLPEDGYAVVYVEKELSPFETLLVDMASNAMVAGVADSIGFNLSLFNTPAMKEIRQTLRLLDAPPEGGKPFKAVAHCFCEI